MECLDRIDHSGVKEKYQEVQKLMEEPGMRGRDKDYEKKKRAVGILMEILEALTHCKEPLCIVVAAITHWNIGVLHSDRSDPRETELATKCFRKCINLLEDSKLTPEGILLAVSANNELGQIYALQELYEEAHDFFKQAEYLYVKFTEDVRLEPIHMTIMNVKDMKNMYFEFIKDPCAKNILEEVHKSTLFSLCVMDMYCPYIPQVER